MQKTLLDEFAMAAMLGWLSSRKDPAVTIDQAKAAASFYDLAEAMMTERAKRELPPSIDPFKEKIAQDLAEIQGFKAPPAPPVSAVNSDLLAVINSMNGRKVTCSELFKAAYLRDGSMEELREVGAILRHRGYQKARSGGKDYYQL